MIKIEIDDVTVDRRLLFFRLSLSLRVLMFNESDSLFPCIAHPFIHKKNVTLNSLFSFVFLLICLFTDSSSELFFSLCDEATQSRVI